MKPSVVQQGQIVVERDPDGFVMMFPNGEIDVKATKREVELAAKHYFKLRLGDAQIGVGRIEWRGSRG